MLSRGRDSAAFGRMLLCRICIVTNGFETMSHFPRTSHMNHPIKEGDGSRIGKCTNKSARRARTLAGRSYRISPHLFPPQP